MTRYIWVYIVSIVLSVLLLYLNLKYISEIMDRINEVNMVIRQERGKKMETAHRDKVHDINTKNQSLNRSTIIREVEEEEKPLLEWSDLSLYYKWRLFSGWSLLMIIGSIITIISSVFLLISTRTSQRDGEKLLGIGGFLIVISLMKYWETTK
jgi:CHASE3 domain sensor protein